MSYQEEMSLLVNQMLDGYALLELIVDGDGQVADFRFVDVNPTFSEMTGLQAEAILARTMNEVLPEIEPYWRERFRQVTMTGNPARFTAYAAPLGRHFEIAAYRPRAAMLAVTFRDVTPEVRSRELIERALEDAVGMVGRVGEVRDPYTAGHQRRVAVLAPRIAKSMGLTPDSIKSVYLGALVHDIGKVAVPLEILNYPGPLAADQYNLMKIHPQAGHDIVKEARLPWPIADIVLQHQERMDGSGYPKGLKGKEIALETRIVTVADVFESITCHRPYRGSHSKEAAIQELHSNVGRLYDADVVRCCLAIAEAKDVGFEAECPRRAGTAS